MDPILLLISIVLAIMLIGIIALQAGMIRKLKLDLTKLAEKTKKETEKQQLSPSEFYPDIAVMRIPPGIPQPPFPKVMEIEREMDEINRLLEWTDGMPRPRPSPEERKKLEEKLDELQAQLTEFFISETDKKLLSDSLTGQK